MFHFLLKHFAGDIYAFSFLFCCTTSTPQHSLVSVSSLRSRPNRRRVKAGPNQTRPNHFTSNHATRLDLCFLALPITCLPSSTFLPSIIIIIFFHAHTSPHSFNYLLLFYRLLSFPPIGATAPYSLGSRSRQPHTLARSDDRL